MSRMLLIIHHIAICIPCLALLLVSHTCAIAISLVAGCQQELDFFQLLHWLLWERSYVRSPGSFSRRAVDWVASPSSRGQWIYSNLLMTTWKVAIRGLCEIRMVEGHTWTERGIDVVCWSGSPLHGVYQFELLWLSDMSTACLWQSSRR
jgi:hypothetical protein